jgi:hypothetical protein
VVHILSGMTFIPAQVADITVDWLNDVLAPAGIGTISDFATERFGEGVGILGELARLTLTYADGASGPTSIVAKCQSPAAENQFLATAMGFYEREVSFYSQVAASLPIRVPMPYHAAAGDGGVPFILLIEDICGARCPDQIAGITADEAGRIIDMVATLHAAYWGRADQLSWLPPMDNPMYRAAEPLAQMRLPGFVARYGDRLDPTILAATERACNNYAAMLDFVARDGATTFTHTDCRAENYLFGGSAGDDAITMVDFQLCTRHFGPWDVANLLGGSMDPQVRRKHEAALIERYHAALVAHGVTGYTLEQCWRQFRLSLLQMCAASVIVSDLEGGNERGTELLEQLFLRPIIAATDHNVGELLDEFC